MEQERSIETGSESFIGEYLQDQVVAKDHFLRKLGEVVDWGYFTKRLINQTHLGWGMAAHQARQCGDAVLDFGRGNGRTNTWFSPLSNRPADCIRTSNDVGKIAFKFTTF